MQQEEALDLERETKNLYRPIHEPGEQLKVRIPAELTQFVYDYAYENYLQLSQVVAQAVAVFRREKEKEKKMLDRALGGTNRQIEKRLREQEAERVIEELAASTTHR